MFKQPEHHSTLVTLKLHGLHIALRAADVAVAAALPIPYHRPMSTSSCCINCMLAIVVAVVATAVFVAVLQVSPQFYAIWQIQLCTI